MYPRNVVWNNLTRPIHLRVAQPIFTAMPRTVRPFLTLNKMVSLEYCMSTSRLYLAFAIFALSYMSTDYVSG